MDVTVNEKDVAKLWGDLIRNPAVHWPETPLRPALEILSDATKAFGANARNANDITRQRESSLPQFRETARDSNLEVGNILLTPSEIFATFSIGV